MEMLAKAETETIEAVSHRIGFPNQADDVNKRDIKKWLRNGGLGITALAAMGVGAWKYFDQSGKYEHFPPSLNQPAQIDNTERIISWNMEGRAAKRHKQIAALAMRYNADVIALQEVDTTDATRLHHDFPAWDVVYALADQKQHITQGGYGNVLMTRQGPTDIKTRSFAGTSLVDSTVGTVTGLSADVTHLNAAFTATKNGWQERRVALAETTKVISGSKLENFRVVDVHISGNKSVHSRQLGQAMDFIKSNLKGGQPMAACGDFNSRNAEITGAFARIGVITPTKQGIHSDYNGDFCGYYMGDETTLAHVTVLNDFRTDHYPLEFTWTLQEDTH